MTRIIIFLLLGPAILVGVGLVIRKRKRAGSMRFDFCPEPATLEGQYCNIEIGGLLDDDQLAAISGLMPSVAKKLDEMSAVRFEVPSFVDLLGERVLSSSGMRRARTEFEVQGWHVTLDRVSDASTVYQEINEDDEHQTTHQGLVRRTDGQTFTQSQFDRFLDVVYWLFSFACATQRGIWAWQGFDEYGRFLVGHRGGLKLGSTRTFSWFPEGLRSPFPVFAEEFASKLDDPFWGDVILFGVHILAESNLDELSSESKMVLGQTALEMLTTAILVEKLAQAPAGSAAQGIRNLLGHIGVPLAVPATLPALSAEATTHGWTDGPDAIVKIRNMLVHPKQAFRTKSLGISGAAKFEATLLSLQYTELVMLWLVGYDGPFVDRTDLPMIMGKNRPTPWVAGGSRP